MQDISIIFENDIIMMRKLNKKLYEKNMTTFREKYGELIDSLLAEIADGAEPEKLSGEVGERCVNQIFAAFEKRGKMKKAVQMEKELYMIYYLFPAILLTGNDKASMLCDGIRDSWNAKFGKNINYTDYDNIYAGFVNKLFGIPIGS